MKNTRESSIKKRSFKVAGKMLGYFAVVCALLLSSGFASQAEAKRVTERYVLNFNDTEIHSGFDHNSVLMLKKTLKDQYPWLDVQDLDLRSVTLFAKSKFGRGAAHLRVGNKLTERYQVDGRPREFDNRHRYTFDRLRFDNPDHDSRGPWQLNLEGNFVVRKVIVEVEKHVHPHGHRDHHWYGWYKHR